MELEAVEEELGAVEEVPEDDVLGVEEAGGVEEAVEEEEPAAPAAGAALCAATTVTTREALPVFPAASVAL